MKCRRCKTVYDNGKNRACPKCGEPPQARPVFLKTSTILISTASQRGVYRSMDEVPAGLRSQLLKYTNGGNAATILIADRKGREEIARAVRKVPSQPSGRTRSVPSRAAVEWRARSMRIAAAAILALFAALMAWAAVGRPWS